MLKYKQAMPITLIIISKENIPSPTWVSSCKSINETLIINDTDHPVNNDFSQKRNYGLKIAKNDWCLFVDTDETPSESMITYLNQFNYDNNVAFRRIDNFLGKQLKFGETGTFYTLRLVNRKTGKFIGKVHEVFKTKNFIKINHPLIHNPHSSFYTFISKINTYSDIRAQELYDQKIKTNLFQIIFYTKAKFIQNYFIKLGFLDGTRGIIHAFGMSLHSFLVRSKLWHMQQH